LSGKPDVLNAPVGSFARLSHHKRKFQMEHDMNLKNNLIKWLGNNDGIQANIITARFREYSKEKYEEIPEAHDVRLATELLIKSNQLIVKLEIIDGKTYKNIYLPKYLLHEKEHSIRELQRSKYNIHNLSLKAIRNRLLKGLSPELALSTPQLKNNQKWVLKNIQQDVNQLHEDLNW
jgi:hypothetical protein